MQLVLSAQLSSTDSLPSAGSWTASWPQLTLKGRPASARSEGNTSSLWNVSDGQDVHATVTRTCGSVRSSAVYTQGCGCRGSATNPACRSSGPQDEAWQEEEKSICKAFESREGGLGCPLSTHQPGSCDPH
uniref:Uncharacterized protein n=1 Tax=Saimiri boliviensis boliviensis TaxID=39432 RepID=A0A2K6U5Z8_SAIBB